MALSSDEYMLLQGLFEGAPAWAWQPRFLQDFGAYATSEGLTAGQTVFTPDSPVEYLYLVASGSVRQTYGLPGEKWFRKDLLPGEFFGQQDLFIGQGQHRSRVTATSDTLIFRLTAADVRILSESYEEFRELLLHEARASRLRSIPLFEGLDEADIPWLALLVEETEIPQDTPVPLGQRSGLWIVDWGQVAISGPVSAQRPGWRLTSGNFFLTPDPNRRSGSNSTASEAVTTLRAKFFYLPEEHFERLLSAFPNMNNMISHPIDITSRLAALKGSQVGTGLTEHHYRHLAQYCAWAFVPSGQDISMQGATGYSLMVLHKGAALIIAVDERGRLRPRSLLQPGGFFGRTSLLEGKVRDATVRAVTAQGHEGRAGLKGAELIVLDRRDLQCAFAERSDLWHTGVFLYDQSIRSKQERPRFDWLKEGEQLIWLDRGHWLWVVVPEVLVFLAFVLIVPGLVLVSRAVGEWLWALVGISRYALATTFLILGCLAFALLFIWFFSNYLNDYYVVTDRRVTRRDKVLLYREVLNQALLEMVQDATFNTILIGRILDFGDVVIRTAAKVGDIRFDHVPDPRGVADLIVQKKIEAIAGTRGQHKEVIRHDLMGSVFHTLSVPDLDLLRALGENVRPPGPLERFYIIRRLLRRLTRVRTELLPRRSKRSPGLTRRVLQWLPSNWQTVLFNPLPPPPRRPTGEVVWRKHPIDLLRRARWPLLCAFLVLVGGFPVISYGSIALGLDRIALVLGWLVLLVPIALWFLWHSVDWYNDLYKVNDDQIIDVEKRPLWLSAKERAGNLDRVQTVLSSQEGLLATVLNYGDVIIRTAAADEGFTFNYAPNPKLVAATIFQRLEAFRRRQEEKKTAEFRRELVDGLDAYHQLREGR